MGVKEVVSRELVDVGGRCGWGVGSSGLLAGCRFLLGSLLTHLAWCIQKVSDGTGLGVGGEGVLPWCCCQWAKAKARPRLSVQGLFFVFFFFFSAAFFGEEKMGNSFAGLRLELCT